MKINLLKRHSSPKSDLHQSILFSAIGLCGAVCLAIVMIIFPANNLKKLKQKAEELEPKANFAYRVSKRAETIIKKAEIINKNIAFYEATEKHNLAYVNLYKNVMNYLPSFFRLTELSAQPKEKKQALVKMTGIVQNYQQYSDLMLALLRIPNAEKVHRSGFENKAAYIPNLVKDDQIGNKIRPGQKRQINSPNKRLEEYLTVGPEQNPLSPTSNANRISQESEADAIKPTPLENEITIYLLLKDTDLQVPSLEMTLGSGKKQQRRRRR